MTEYPRMKLVDYKLLQALKFIELLNAREFHPNPEKDVKIARKILLNFSNCAQIKGFSIHLKLCIEKRRSDQKPCKSTSNQIIRES